jgi:hypothetical protein
MAAPGSAVYRPGPGIAQAMPISGRSIPTMIHGKENEFTAKTPDIKISRVSAMRIPRRAPRKTTFFSQFLASWR